MSETTDAAAQLALALEALVSSVRMSIPSARMGLSISVALNVAERELRMHRERSNGQTTVLG